MCGVHCCMWCSVAFLYTTVLYQYTRTSITLTSSPANTTPSYTNPSHIYALQYFYTGYCTAILRRQKHEVLLRVTITLQHDRQHTCNNIEARSYKYCCSEETISIAYSEFVFVVFLYPACNAHAPYYHPWLNRLYNICSHYLLKGTIFGKKNF